MLIAAQQLPSFPLTQGLEQRPIFAAMTAGERIVLLEETSRIKTTALHHTVQGFGFLAIFPDLDRVEAVNSPFDRKNKQGGTECVES